MAFGVYGIVFPDNWIYIGSTIANFDTRHRVHLKALRDNKHDNDKMQELWNKHHKVDFIILEATENKDEVRELEQYYMEQLPKEGYKLCNETPALVEGNALGDIVKKKISEGRRGAKTGRKKISDYKDMSPEEKRGLSEYHKRNYELRKEQGW